MNEDRLAGLLGTLRTERMDRIADDRTRTRLENAWTTRQQRRAFSFRIRQLAPVLATIALFAGLGASTMNAAGDSPLYGIRVAVEDAAIALRPTPEDKAEYVLALLDQRQTEAARLEQSGNALAASHVREIERQTLRLVQSTLPTAPEVDVVLPTPTPSPTPSPTVEPTASPTPVPTPSPTTPRTPTPTVRPSTPVPTPVRTDTPTATAKPTSTPVPTPSPTAIAVTAFGHVTNADATPAAGVCVRLTTATATCLTTTAADGSYRLTSSAKVGQTIYIILTRQDGTVLWKGYTSAVVRGPTVQMPDVKLQK
jgi:outer membrane biosynthesis protein TonB